ncbi:MAG: hypothetical protein ABUL73_04505 [Alphaproteobacteria bacterium]
MRVVAVLTLCVGLAACGLFPFPGATPHVTSSTLTPADAATGLITGGPLTMAVSAPAAQPASGEDPLITMSLARGDGASMAFTEANHAPDDVRAQAVGGPLAQAMGLFNGDETPTLYAVDTARNKGALFICAPDGPAYVGVYTAADGSVSVVGLKSAFQFETLADGAAAALPYSPDHVCARLHFKRG